MPSSSSSLSGRRIKGRPGADGALTAERIRLEFKKGAFSGLDIHVTVSIGIAQYRPQEELKTFVHRVGQLMYESKRSGKDRA